MDFGIKLVITTLLKACDPFIILKAPLNLISAPDGVVVKESNEAQYNNPAIETFTSTEMNSLSASNDNEPRIVGNVSRTETATGCKVKPNEDGDPPKVDD